MPTSGSTRKQRAHEGLLVPESTTVNSQREVSLRKPFAKGVAWSGSSSVITSVVRVLVLAVLARLLLPSDFGLFSLTLLVVDFGNDLGDFGTGPAIIQGDRTDREYLSSIFWMVILGGLVLMAAGMAVAPLLAWFFETPLLNELIMVASLSFVIRPFGFVHRSVLQKALEFRRIAVVEITATVVFGLVSISLAYRGYGVWSLVLGIIAHRVADVVVLWVVSGFRG